MARRQWSIAGQLFALQALVVTLLVLAGAAGVALLARSDSNQAAEQEVLAVAQTVANAPGVRAALTAADPSATLQPYAEATRTATGTDFVVVMAPNRTRYSHPNPDLIGQPFIGDIGPALAGQPFTTTNVGTLGESVRAVVPVYGDGHRIIGLVSVGITTKAINRKLLGQVPVLLGGAVPALALAATGSWLLSRRLRRQTHGLGPSQMTRMYEYYDAVLHSVREGLLVLTRDGRVALVNDEGRRLLGLAEDAAVTDRPVSGIDLPPAVAELLDSGRDAHDEPILAGDRVLVANQRTTRFEGTVLGTVLTLRDQTELRNLASELDSVRALTEALQAQTHESANRLHTVLTLVELGRTAEAVQLATRDLALAQQLTDRVVGAVTEPALAALLLGKSARAGERGVDLVIEPDCRLDDSPLPTTDLLTVVGNLVDNALEAVAGTPPPRRVRVFVGAADDEIVVRVGDSGPGLDPDRVADAFRRGWSTKSAGRGLGLALVGQVVRRHGGRTDVARAEDGGTLFTVRLPIPREAT
ncbi:sensor histidine kinase [Micromonospora sp. DR5-3]|uniref:ATP-binding protein n=1 Tax=unclassified Micromonospora TaxID=2617518 RepID=UPI0011D7E49A|nr:MULTISPECIES: sensor histidine kinase [unclassified Micromonospora]MCW3819680.1 sensor histidine kinase [Micromonospora sp. DR5-3]TYC20425.1 sensor histidine kinase [Micromonospora sp. MP36]